ncbi:MAG: single-stranded-DNA-specific exonuclease RecJ [Clostridia bacterium]|nr:single-stranded-DNA-specific exonuclease RecJ [Clostridia bacterium]MDD4386704.1 single-stranded-DNA-specific exonuclease RecJ [Clostridia bacterium]
MQKLWNVKSYDEEYISKIMDRYKISAILSKLIVSHGIAFDDIKDFLKANLENLKDPYLIKDMNKFVDRVSNAISKGEKICIYGDYDVDGITSIIIMYKFLEELGANVSYYLPDRLSEGYGLNRDALNNIRDKGTSLLITVDCGITAIEEIKYASGIGLHVCVTDHHECSDELPDAICIVNPKQSGDKSEFKFHAGVGVAFKCITALSMKHNLNKDRYLKYLDIAAVGTISDIVPLTGENRIIAKFGIEAMKVTKNIGLSAILKLVGSNEIDSILVSFALAPRINACGRMGNAGLAVELLLAKNLHEANKIALKLDEQNKLRQQVEKNIFDQALKMVEENEADKKSSIVLYDENWHNGVIGIVASKLVNIYFKPVILFTKENGVIRGSGRCEVGFSLYEALTKCKDLLIQFGGHELAAGMTIESDKIEQFKNKFDEIVNEISPGENKEIIDIDAEITRDDLNINTIIDTISMKPYGQGNKEPVFIYKGLKVQAISTIKDGKHLKLTLRDMNSLLIGIAFSSGHRRDELVVGDKIVIVGNISINTFTSPKTIQFIIKDFKKS